MKLREDFTNYSRSLFFWQLFASRFLYTFFWGNLRKPQSARFHIEKPHSIVINVPYPDVPSTPIVAVYLTLVVLDVLLQSIESFQFKKRLVESLVEYEV